MKNILIALIAIISLAGCIKKNNIHGDLKNRREILMTRYWRIESMKDNGKYVDIESCKRDNYYVFLEDGEGRWEESLNNCFDTVVTPPPVDSSDSTTFPNPNVVNPPVPTYTAFRWSMVADLQYIYFKDFGRDGYDPEWEIENMDYSSLSVLYSELIDGVNHRYEVELKAL